MKIALIYGFELNNYNYMQGESKYYSPFLLNHCKTFIVLSIKLFQFIDWKINYNKKKAKEKRT